MSRAPAAALVASIALAAVLAAAPAHAEPPRTYLFDPGGAVRGVRTLDMDGDGRRDVVALLEHADGTQHVLVLRTPATPRPRTLYPDDHVTRVPCTGDLAAAGAIAVGRFGAKGAGRLRFLGRDGVRDLDGHGRPVGAQPRPGSATLFARSPGRGLVFWDGVADLDGDGLDECWFPAADGDGPIRILGGTPSGDRVLSIAAKNLGASNGIRRLARHAYVPNLFPADLDGDGRRELVALREQDLVAWSATGKPDAHGVLQPSYRLHLPFLEDDPDLGAADLRTPRIQLEDVDGDGISDLLVTLITGVRTKLTSIRTILFHYPGPFRDEATGRLVAPRTRIDTQSIVLHPSFVDIDGDGDRDYVGDSIRGTMLDLIARMMGRDPKVTLVGFAFDRKTGTFEAAPCFRVARPYPSKEALNNKFGQNAWFDGDFDGDGTKDLLDLGNLTSVGIARGAKAARGGFQYEAPLLGRIPVAKGLQAAARTEDLDGDGRADAVLWSRTTLYFVLSGGGGR